MRILAGTLAVLLLGSGGSGGGSTEIKFHHVHYRVGDPSAAMSDAVRRFNGMRVIVPGLGVGVRVGNEYLLFDRNDGGDQAPEQPPFAEAYNVASDWLARRMLPTGRMDVPALVMPDLRPDHVAFATYGADFPAVIEAIAKRSGVTVLERRDDSFLFGVNGVRIEIVRHTNRPDVFWCPMHPDVRAPEEGKCSLCGMALVRIPPPTVGEYRLDVLPQASAGGRGLNRLRLIVREPDTNVMVTRFARVHERFFHLFVISRDLEYFEHVHPFMQADGSLALDLTIPPGEYMLVADFLPEGGTPQMVQRALIAPGGALSQGPDSPKPDSARRVVREGTAISLDVQELAPGKEAPMTFTVTDAATGAPVTDLGPYLGAPAHMLMVKSDLSDAIHAHPEEQQTSGPTVSFHPLMPAAGDYKLWIQFQRGGKVITFPFWLQVPR